MAKERKALVPREQRIRVQHEYSSMEQFVAEYVTNISRTGVFIHTKKPLPVGSKVTLDFTIVEDDLIRIEGVGEVVRTSQSPLGMGVVFTSLNSHTKDLLERIITRRAAGPRRRRA